MTFGSAPSREHGVLNKLQARRGCLPGGVLLAYELRLPAVDPACCPGRILGSGTLTLRQTLCSTRQCRHTQADAMLADVRARVAAAVAAREAAVKAVASPEATPSKPAVTPSRQKVLHGR